MFSEAYEKASKFTCPVITSSRNFNGDVFSGGGAFVIVNKDGWIITAAHIFNTFQTFQQHQEILKKLGEEENEIQNSTKLNPKRKRERINKLKKQMNHLITHHSFWWGADGFRVKNINIFSPGDIAIAQIDNYKHEEEIEYPKFKNPKNIKLGTSLCKLGYPLIEVKTNFVNGNFFFEDETFPIPRFPIEGIFTRNINLKSEDKKLEFDVKFIETSSPGLRGQSGGPIFDKDGSVWGIQSHTVHHPLGFNPKIKKSDGTEVEENQFLSVGVGIHPELIFEFLKKHKVYFDVID